MISSTFFRKEVRMTQGLGVSYGVSQGIIFFAYAALFYLGAYLIAPDSGRPEWAALDFEGMMM